MGVSSRIMSTMPFVLTKPFNQDENAEDQIHPWEHLNIPMAPFKSIDIYVLLSKHHNNVSDK